MRITEIEARLYRIPPAVHIEDAIQRVSHWEFIISTVRTDAGISGTGFAYTNGMGGSAIRELVETYLAPLVQLQKNLGEVDPEKWVVFLFYSHPPLGERIAKANRWK